MEKESGGSCVFRTEQSELKQQQRFQQKQQEKMENLYKQLEMQFEKDLKQG